MKARDLEWAILKAVARVRNDEWLPCSLGDLRNRVREVDADAGNASFNSMAEAAISLNQEGHLQLGKREDGIRRLPFDLQKQFDEGYISNFFGRGSFELKMTHQGRKYLEESEQSTVNTGPQAGEAPATTNGEVQKPGRESEQSNAPKKELPKGTDALSALDRRLQELDERARSYFDDALVSYRASGSAPVFSPSSDVAAAVRSKSELRGNELASNLRDLTLQLIEAVSHSPLVPKADVDDLKITIRKMTAALRFREYTHYGSYVVHEEDRVFGIQPESSQEINVSPEQAQSLFSEGMRRLLEVVNDFIDPRSAGRTRNPAPEGVHPKMRRTAVILKVLIASPSDVSAERDAVESAIHEWNANHHELMGIVLLPVRWETHSFPASGDRPQAIINKQIVDSGDILIGVFGYRLGTPTGVAQSGTIEEIERFRNAGKYVALYFSNADIPRSADREQLQALDEYRLEREKDTLYGIFRTDEELRRLVTRHLPKIVAVVSAGVEGSESITSPEQAPCSNGEHFDYSETNEDLSPKEIELLWNAAKDRDGVILHTKSMDGEGIQTNGKQFVVNADARMTAEWVAGLRGLEERGLIEPRSHSSSVFQVTGDGYKVADELEGFARWDAKSIILRGRYTNAPDDELTLACKGIVAIPPRYFDDQIGADGLVQRSLREPRTLLVEGLSSRATVAWNPTEIEFLDSANGQNQTLRVAGMEFVPPASLKLGIVG
jgi:hypothetical protein